MDGCYDSVWTRRVIFSCAIGPLSCAFARDHGGRAYCKAIEVSRLPISAATSPLPLRQQVQFADAVWPRHHPLPVRYTTPQGAQHPAKIDSWRSGSFPRPYVSLAKRPKVVKAKAGRSTLQPRSCPAGPDARDGARTPYFYADSHWGVETAMPSPSFVGDKLPFAA